MKNLICQLSVICLLSVSTGFATREADLAQALQGDEPAFSLARQALTPEAIDTQQPFNWGSVFNFQNEADMERAGRLCQALKGYFQRCN